MTDVFRKIQEMRPTAVLTAEYVFTSSLTCLEFDYYSLLIDYERDAVGGGVTWKVEFSLDGTIWYQGSLYEADTLAAGSDATAGVQKEEFTYVSTGADQEFFVFGPREINQFAKYMRVGVIESGQGKVGDCGVTAVLTRRKQAAMN